MRPVSGHPLLDPVTRSLAAECGQLPAVEIADDVTEVVFGAAALRTGSVRIAVWAFVWSAHAGYAVGAWDEAAADADRAVSLLEETGHEWLRPLARCAAVLVPAARGEWTTAEEHTRAASARPGDYELMVVAAALAQAHLAAARTIMTPCSGPWNRSCSSPPATASTNQDSGLGKASTGTRWSTRAG